MIRRSLKYFLIFIGNFILLSVFLILWLDYAEIVFDGYILFYEFFRIVVVSLLTLVGMRILVSVFRKLKIVNVRRKVLYSIGLTVLISSYLYIPYSVKILQNKFLNPETRESLVSKMDEGSFPKADSLTFAEYAEVVKMLPFPEIPASSSNISFEYYSDSFLGDFNIQVIYEVQLSEPVSEMKYVKGQYSKTITIDSIGKIKKVFYEENLW